MAKPRKGTIDPTESAKRYIRPGKKGRFNDKRVRVSRSLAVDRRSNAERKVKRSHGNRSAR